MKLLRILPGILAFSLQVEISGGAVEAPLEIGWAECDITPPLDGPKKVPLSGQYYERAATNVHSRLKFTVCAMRQGDEQVLMGSLDNVSGGDPFLAKVRERVCRRVPGIRPDSIWIACTHAHSAPTLATAYTPMNGVWSKWYPDMLTPDEYADSILERVVDCFVEAWRSARPGRLSRASGRSRVGHCRIVVYRDGTSEMYGDTSRPDFDRILDGEDDTVELLFTEDLDGRKTGAFVNAACPSQVMELMYEISSDFAGALREKLAARHGQDFHTIYLLGAAGCQSPRDLSPEGRKLDPFDGWHRDAVDAISDRLLACVEEAIPRAIPCTPRLRHSCRRVVLPVRRVSEAEVAAAKAETERIDARFPGGSAWDAYYRDMREHEKNESRLPYDTKLHPFCLRCIDEAVLERARTQDREPFLDIEMHVTRLGEAAFITHPFELYLAYGKNIKARSAAAQTFLVGKSGDGGYLPTEASEKAVGYSGGVNVGKVGHEGGKLFCDAAVVSIDELFRW